MRGKSEQASAFITTITAIAHKPRAMQHVETCGTALSCATILYILLVDLSRSERIKYHFS